MVLIVSQGIHEVSPRLINLHGTRSCLVDARHHPLRHPWCLLYLGAIATTQDSFIIGLIVLLVLHLLRLYVKIIYLRKCLLNKDRRIMII